MTKKSMDQLLSQIAEILEMVEDNKNKKAIEFSPETLINLDILESAMPIIKQHLQELYQESNVESEKVIKEYLDSPKASEKEKKFLKQTMEMEEEANILKEAFSRTLKEKKKRKKTGDSKQKKERRKLFKPLGGDQSWIPL